MKFASSVIAVVAAVASAQEPNPPIWPKSVHVFEPENTAANQQVIDTIFAENGGHIPAWNGEFSNSRYALLFKPGYHDVDVPVGYYTEVMGLGRDARDTEIRHVISENGDFNYEGGALANFWRGVTNFKTRPPTGTMTWAVSQATFMRRVVIDGNLDLFQYNYGDAAGYASGGFLANSYITGVISSGSQQQWFTRNTDMGAWNGGVWNMVMLGCQGAPPTQCSNNNGAIPITNVRETPVIAEKPYVAVLDSNSTYKLIVPPLYYNQVGSTDIDGFGGGTITFDRVFVATEDNTAAEINAKLAQGLAVVLTPGNYKLLTPIVVERSGAVILGMGYPTLIASNGQPVITVADGLSNVRISGVFMQAGTEQTDALLQWGTPERRDPGNPFAPNFMHDIFARVGGPNDPRTDEVMVDTMVKIYQGNVVIDNAWLWRADHGAFGLVYNSDNPVKHGIEVFGDDVTAYGLMVEHTLEDMTIWNGERGRVYMYQSELPYDVTPEHGITGYVGYKVNATVDEHQAWGVGVYTYFRDYDVNAPMGISCPEKPGVQFTNSLSVFLNGRGSLQSVINGQGEVVAAPGEQSYVCAN